MNCSMSGCRNGKNCNEHLDEEEFLDHIEETERICLGLKTPEIVEKNDLEPLQLQDINLLTISSAVACLDLTPTAQRSTSTNNTDICVLHESHYGIETEKGEFNAYDACHWLDDAPPDFTVLHAPQLKVPDRLNHKATLNDSTEVLLIHSENETPGTDSDVEVLLSEEVIDSDWSAGPSVAAIEILEFGTEGTENNSIESDRALNGITASTGPMPNISPSASVRHQASTDLDISVDEFSHNSIRSYDHLSRSQLLGVIRQLESTILRYRNAQQRLFDQVDALRLETDGPLSLESEKHKVVDGDL